MWFIEEIGEFAEVIRQFQNVSAGSEELKFKKRIGEELADILAWLCSLANILKIDLQNSAISKYPCVCKKCGLNPCNCDRN